MSAPRAPAWLSPLTMSARWALLGWLLCAIVMLWLFRGDLTTLAFSDPDDAMRLAQVRDWIGGQDFYDVSQHRMNPPVGGFIRC